MSDDIIARIRKFLDTKADSDKDGKAKVSKEDFNELYDIFYEIINHKWYCDVDGSAPIEFDMINRTEHEGQFFFHLPYLYRYQEEAPSVEKVDHYIDLAASNVSISMDKLNYGLKIKKDIATGLKKQSK